MEETDALRIFGALAQTTRLQAFRLLVHAGPDGLAAGDIADALGVPAPTLSFHLKELTRSGLVTFRRDGRSLRYALRAERLNAFVTFLTEDCCHGRPELCVPRVSAARGEA